MTAEARKSTAPAQRRDEPSRLARRLGTFDAVTIGLGAMIGAGVFAAIGPAAHAAGAGLLIALLVAAFVAYCNATSSAELASLYPESGGTYVYGRKRLGAFWGFIAGWEFVIGKLASCAAMALTFGYYAAPGLARPLAVGAVAALTAVNYFGVSKTALLTRAIVAVVLAVLGVFVAAVAFGGRSDIEHLQPLFDGGVHGILQAAGLLFFAFAGYARIATLGEEVIDPAHTIPRAIPLALAITLVVYAAVAVSALLAVGADALAQAPAPLVVAIESGRWAALSALIRVGAAVASLGVLLSLLAGVSRTAFAMASNRDLPALLDAVHPRYRVPARAEVVAGAIVAAIVALSDIRNAIGFSSFAVLTYYAIANACALTLTARERKWPRWLAICGLVGCAALAFSLPSTSVLAGAGLLLAGAGAFGLRKLLRTANRR
jgi:APA family basic amino acid/polyamine antiporter